MTHLTRRSLFLTSLVTTALAGSLSGCGSAPLVGQEQNSGGNAEVGAPGQDAYAHRPRQRYRPAEDEATREPLSAQPASKTIAGPPKCDSREVASLDQATPEPSTEHYTDYGVRPFVDASADNRSTFSVDVDTGAYTIARRKLKEGRLPPHASVRVEEFVNYFRQDYADPKGEGVFTIQSEAAPSPFRSGKVLLRVGLQGKRLRAATRKRSNLVFLVDTSGSMQSSDKMGLLKRSLQYLVENLNDDDVVSICTYAGSVRQVLAPTPAAERGRIVRALSYLRAGGSTAMSSGIDLAYLLASKQASPEVNTRVIVCSDGDANVGATSHEAILKKIARYRLQGITLGTIGFGMGNYKDTMMEQLANKGQGTYSYIDTMKEAKRLFGEELISNLEVIARDVKLQVVFDPMRVKRYRLLGYENRAIRDRDFRNDAVDAGEIGAGHTVTALYELELVDNALRGPLGKVSLRFKPGVISGPGADEAAEASFALTSTVPASFSDASQRFRFTACVAEFAEILRKSPHVQTRLEHVAALTEECLGERHDDREHDFVDMVQRAIFLNARG